VLTSLLKRFNVVRRDGVPPFAPELPGVPVFEANHDSLDFLLTTVINGHLAALQAPMLASKLWIRPKEAFLHDLVFKHAKPKSRVHKVLKPAT
jgi:hypothetical protein